MSDRPDRINHGRGWKLADRKEGREILEKVTVSRKKTKLEHAEASGKLSDGPCISIQSRKTEAVEPLGKLVCQCHAKGCGGLLHLGSCSRVLVP